MTSTDSGRHSTASHFVIRPALLVPLLAVVFAALVGLLLIASIGVSVRDAIVAFLDGTIEAAPT